jgi:hypothetical protein
MAEWARRPPFYVLSHGHPQVIVGRYVDVHKIFSDTQTFASEMPRGPGWEQFNKIMDARFVTQMDSEQHARVDESHEGSRPDANYHDRFGYRQERVPGPRHRRQGEGGCEKATPAQPGDGFLAAGGGRVQGQRAGDRDRGLADPEACRAEGAREEWPYQDRAPMGQAVGRPGEREGI